MRRPPFVSSGRGHAHILTSSRRSTSSAIRLFTFCVVLFEKSSLLSYRLLRPPGNKTQGRRAKRPTTVVRPIEVERVVQRARAHLRPLHLDVGSSDASECTPLPLRKNTCRYTEFSRSLLERKPSPSYHVRCTKRKTLVSKKLLPERSRDVSKNIVSRPLSRQMLCVNWFGAWELVF